MKQDSACQRQSFLIDIDAFQKEEDINLGKTASSNFLTSLELNISDFLKKKPQFRWKK